MNGKSVPRFRPDTKLRNNHTYRAVITFNIDRQSFVTHYWLGDSTTGGWGSNENGPVGVHVLQQGESIVSGQSLVLLWRPTGLGQHSLVITYDGIGPPPYRRETRISDSVIEVAVVA